eukprot:34803_1
MASIASVVYLKYIAKYKCPPNSATHLTNFSKSKEINQPISYKDAKHVMNQFKNDDNNNQMAQPDKQETGDDVLSSMFTEYDLNEIEAAVKPPHSLINIGENIFKSYGKNCFGKKETKIDIKSCDYLCRILHALQMFKSLKIAYNPSNNNINIWT